MKFLSIVITIVIINSTTFAQTITGSGSIGYLPKFSGTSVITSSLIYDNGTKIGIGTKSPRTKLDIWGGDITVTGAGFSGTAYITSVGGIAYFSDNTYDKGIAVNPNGNVGIGTLTPTAMLDVNGTAKFSTDLLVNGLTVGKGGGNILNNTVFGTSVGQVSTSATGNTFMGYQSAMANTTGSGNVFNGYLSGKFNTSGNNNVFVGNSAGLNNTTGFQNSFFGQGAGVGNTTSSNNSFFGAGSGYDNTTGSNNTYYGANTGRNITIGNNNTIIGANVTNLAAGLSNNVIIADGSGNKRIIVDNNGFVGIGVINPTANLEVASGLSNGLRVGITSNRANTSTQLASSLAVIGNNNMATTISGAVAWDFYNNGSSPSSSGAFLQHIGTGVTGTLYGMPGANQGQLVFQNVSNAVIGTNGANLFVAPGSHLSTSFFTDGSVGIGTTDTKGYKLAVNGTAVFTRAVVKLYGNWPDYVFSPLYQLPTLHEVKVYINKYQHLADMPAADDIKKDGIDLGDNQVKLLKKVEELTLYLIDLNEKLERLFVENEVLKKKVNSINH